MKRGRTVQGLIAGLLLALLGLAGCGNNAQTPSPEGGERIAAEESSGAAGSEAGPEESAEASWEGASEPVSGPASEPVSGPASEPVSGPASEPGGSNAPLEDLLDGFLEQEPIPVPEGKPVPLPKTDAVPNLDEYRPNDGKSGVPLFNAFGAYSGQQALLENEISGFGEIWWFNDAPVTAMYTDRVFADGACYDGVCEFGFQDRRSPAEMAALYGVTEEELQWSCMDQWPWNSWQNLTSGWVFYVTLQPMEGEWFCPSGWVLSTEDETFEDYARRVGGTGDGENKMLEMYLAGELGPKNPQPASQYQYPAFQPVEGHEGLEMALVAETPSGLPLQVRFRWKTEDGFGCWAEVPGWAVERFYEHLGQWFVKVDTGTEAAE